MSCEEEKTASSESCEGSAGAAAADEVRMKGGREDGCRTQDSGFRWRDVRSKGPRIKSARVVSHSFAKLCNKGLSREGKREGVANEWRTFFNLRGWRAFSKIPSLLRTSSGSGCH